jgi:hypothetical protein
MPWLMHAAARGETGSGATEEGEVVAGSAETVGLGAGAELRELTPGVEIPCGFPSSFFHMRHLDVETGFSKSLLAGDGSELRLRRVNIVQHLVAVNKNGG